MSNLLLACKSPFTFHDKYDGVMPESFKNKRMLAKRIKDLRELKEWSQRELGRRSGVSQKSISNLENPEAIREAPKMDIVEKVADALGVEIWQLFVPSCTEALLDNYIHSTPDGRQHISRVAELEAKFGRTE